MARWIFLIGFLAFAIVTIGLAPIWMPLTSSGDAAAIDYERAQRRWRATWGLSMPDQPDLARLPQRLAENGLVQGAPVLIRIFKREFELEIWMMRNGMYHRFATYPICRWSGTLGPKLVEGDRQAPEGFYTVDATALNPNSRWYRSFNLGYPNAYDQSLKRTGSLIMVHGGCASIGCFAMTNAQMDEIWTLITSALTNGQKRFQVQVYPFHLSDEKLAGYGSDSAIAFWRSLKTGNDLFETTLQAPAVTVCNGHYDFVAGTAGLGSAPVIENRCPSNTPKT